MTHTIDASGLACPGPVLQVKNLFENSTVDEIAVLVSGESAKHSVTKFLSDNGFAVKSIPDGLGYKVHGIRSENETVSLTNEKGVRSKIIVLVSSDRLGRGDDELGKKLMVNYIKTLKEMGDELWQIIFVNSGVSMVVESSPVVEDLKQYVDLGITVLACGTCLEHFGLIDWKVVGESTNMLDIVTATQVADKVITIS
ncbi:MAG: sulfurtransferase-like selenium metabolism protein YedF [Desulfobulbaceae bacterium]|nr:MAG: sulfurtransferase-like selenium metabolism protein YedF [Desulfobulbaceae bacterium]